MMVFEGKLPVFKNRKTYQNQIRRQKKKNDGGPSADHIGCGLSWLAFAVFVEIRFVAFDRELPALSNCEDDPASHHLFSITGNVGHVVGGECACCCEYVIIEERLKWKER